MNREHILTDFYALIAELWCGPPVADAISKNLQKDAEEVVKKLQSIDKEAAMLLASFLSENAIAEEDYIDLFELDPQCALYLGSHSYDEPKTCANAAISDRNEYMIDLVGIYRHFGQSPNGTELPDYLPLMLDFLALTAESKDDPIREKLIDEYLLPYLPPMRSRLEQLQTPYLNLFDAMEKVICWESKSQPLPDQPEKTVRAYVG
jgi:nitrate reductase delta subunit